MTRQIALEVIYFSSPVLLGVCVAAVVLAIMWLLIDATHEW